jgi:LPXTG-motif cell wall-anchored protein
MLANVLPDDATYKDVVWSVEDGTGSANISQSGLLTAISNGSVMVTATAVDGSGISDSIAIAISGQSVNYPVTVTGGTGSGTYPEGEAVTISADIAPAGQQFAGWTFTPSVTFTGGTSASSPTAQFIMPAQEVTATANYEPILPTYQVIQDFGTWTSGDAVAKIDGDHTKFVQLTREGVEVSADDYTVSDGSTVITLKESYIKTLGANTHAFSAVFTDGRAALTLTKEAAASEATANTPASSSTKGSSATPQTGDDSTAILLVALMMICALGLLGAAAWQKKREDKAQGR